MSEAYREQRPLLCDDLSDEEHFRAQPKRFRPMVYVGRARINAKGAAAIINRWPDHWSTSLKYWWTGIGMISIAFFIIYNIIFALALIPPENLQARRLKTSNNKEYIYKGTSSLPDVFMHIFVNFDEEIDLNKYLPIIETISNEYSDFKYNLIIVLNNMFSENNSLSAEEQNEIALNSLWGTEHFDKKHVTRKNINIEYITLSKYMNESPIRKHWRQLPHEYIEFLVRAVSIWEKGGIALNPTILTSQCPHTIYRDKLLNILQKYGKCKEHRLHNTKVKQHQQQKQTNPKENSKKKVNNIRDIIDNLERDESSSNFSQITLTEAEDKYDPVTVHSGRHLLSVIGPSNSTEMNSESSYVDTKYFLYLKDNETDHLNDKKHPNKNYVKSHDTLEKTKVKNSPNIEIISEALDGNRTSLSLLPLFLEFLFHDKPKHVLSNINREVGTKDNVTRHRKSAMPVDNFKGNTNTTLLGVLNKTEAKINDKHEPMIISAKGIPHDEQLKINDKNEIPTNNEKHEHIELTLDLEGNILATETSCHAFLGTVFSNVVHYTREETLKDFIIAELSIFCKGLLSSCKGIDLILL